MSGTMNAKDVGEVLGISQDGVYKMVKRGHIEAVKVGGRIEIPISEVVREASKRQPRSVIKIPRKDG